METSAYHLAQLNVGKAVAPLDSEEMAEFMAGLAPINALADHAPGFVWRLKGEDSDNATDVRIEGVDLIFNLSVWESRETLWDFAYRTAHLDYLRRRREWFVHAVQPIHVMWWIPAGTIPDLGDALRRLDLLREQGPGPDAFTFRDFYESPASSPGRSQLAGGKPVG